MTITSITYRWLHRWLNRCLRSRFRIGERSALNEEAGFSTFLTGIAMMFMLLSALYIFLPYVDTYTSRRFSQNGADAAAHAGAGRYADDLTIRWPRPAYIELSRAYCPSSHPYSVLLSIRDQARKRAVQIYKTYYRGYVASAMGSVRAEAAQYASANSESQLRGFFANVSRRHGEYNFYHPPSRETLYPIYVKADTERNYTPWTGSSFDAPAQAAAIAFVTKVRPTVDRRVVHPFIVDRWGNRCFTWKAQYHYSWEITMIKYE